VFWVLFCVWGCLAVLLWLCRLPQAAVLYAVFFHEAQRSLFLVLPVQKLPRGGCCLYNLFIQKVDTQMPTNWRFLVRLEETITPCLYMETEGSVKFASSDPEKGLFNFFVKMCHLRFCRFSFSPKCMPKVIEHTIEKTYKCPEKSPRKKSMWNWEITQPLNWRVET
jgi:hypothetical protein